MLWERLLPVLYKWDRALGVLDEELKAIYEHMQAFYDQRVAAMETEQVTCWNSARNALLNS